MLLVTSVKSTVGNPHRYSQLGSCLGILQETSGCHHLSHLNLREKMAGIEVTHQMGVMLLVEAET